MRDRRCRGDGRSADAAVGFILVEYFVGASITKFQGVGGRLMPPIVAGTAKWDGSPSVPLPLIDLVQDLVYSIDMARPFYNIHDAKTRFSKLLARVARGEEVVIARAGKAVAKLVPIVPPPRAREPGSAAHIEMTMRDDFDEIPGTLRESFGV
jgi:prevent-host-death family protein